jgi:hypothetical protein
LFDQAVAIPLPNLPCEPHRVDLQNDIAAWATAAPQAAFGLGRKRTEPAPKIIASDPQ